MLNLPCPTESTLHAYARGTLEVADAEVVIAHLDECEVCAAAVEGLSRFESPLKGGATELRPPDGDETILSEIGLSVGEQVGPYELMEQIGVGGMGVVYVARQREPIRRDVALKVIKPGTDTKEVITRFEAERQALALMDHPNIARVLDAGATRNGLPFFVMELVRGTPITQFCDERQLDSRQRLRLFQGVCHAVQHAHQKGVIHRDIKPQNVLVTLADDKPVAKVIDFGVAKAISQKLTEHSIYTRFAQLVGTPLYMSPEQADLNSADVDTRSDIYSLGVLLYELLTGRTPIDRARLKQASLDEALRLIKEEEPPKPSTRISSLDETGTAIAASRGTAVSALTRLLRGDLDWIVMKALDKDRTRRYETANGLARDIERYLTGDRVEASPPSALYRLRKFYSRNRGVVLATGLVLATLVTGIVGTGYGLVQAQANERRALEQSKLAASTLREVVVKVQGAMSDLPGSADVRREILNESLAALDLVDSSQDDSFESRQARIVVHSELGTLALEFGGSNSDDGRQEALEHFRQSLALAEDWAKGQPDDWTARTSVISGKTGVGKCFKTMGEFQKAEEHLMESLEVTEREMARCPGMPTDEFIYGCHYMVNHELGILFFVQFRMEQAVERLRAALAALKVAIAKGGRAVERDYPERIASLEGHIETALETLKARKNIDHVATLRPAMVVRVLYMCAKWEAFEGNFLEAAKFLDRMEGMECSPADYYNNACGYCRCITAMESAAKKVDSEQQLRQGYTTKAVECLKRAGAVGLFDDPYFRAIVAKDDDLNPIRDSAGFLEFNKQLKAMDVNKNIANPWKRPDGDDNNEQ